MATGDNFITCGNDFDLQTIWMSLYGADANGCVSLRLYLTDNISNCSPVQCATFQTLTDMLRSSIAIAFDGRPALRVVATDISELTTGSAFQCGLGLTWDEALKSIFVNTSSGNEMGVFLGKLNANTDNPGTPLVTCGNDMDLDSMLMSLIGEVEFEWGNCNFLRTHMFWGESFDCKPIACATFQSFLDLLRQAIVVTDDGRPALRVYAFTELRSLYSAFGCAGGVTEDEALNGIFWSVGGYICVAAASIYNV